MLNPTFLYIVLNSVYFNSNPVIKAALVTPSFSPAPPVLGTISVTDNEVAGVARVTVANAYSGQPTSEGVRLHCDDLVFAGLDGSTVVGGVVLYDETHDQIIAWDMSDSPFTPPAGDLTYTVDPDTGFAAFTV